MSKPQTVWKIGLDVGKAQRVVLTKGARILSVHLQRGEAYVWVMLDPEATKEIAIVEAYGTGHRIAAPDGLVYIGSTFDESGSPLVFHFFERGPRTVPS